MRIILTAKVNYFNDAKSPDYSVYVYSREGYKCMGISFTQNSVPYYVHQIKR